MAKKPEAKDDVEAGNEDTRVEGVVEDHPENRITLSPSLSLDGVDVDTFLLLKATEEHGPKRAQAHADSDGRGFKSWLSQQKDQPLRRTVREWRSAFIDFNNKPV